MKFQLSDKKPYYICGVTLEDGESIDTITSIVFPSEVDGVKIDTVDCSNNFNKNWAVALAFEEGINCITGFRNSNITSVDFPSTLKDLPSSGFSSCFNLTSVKFKNGTNPLEIQKFCFSGSSINDVEFPANIRCIEDRAFEECCLKSIKFASPSTLDSVGKRAFAHCTNLKRVEFPEMYFEPAKFADYTFLADSKLEYVHFAKNTTKKLAKGMFKNCYKLKTVVFPKTLKEILSEVFNGCKNLSPTVDLRKTNVTSIGSYAFCGTGITAIHFPKTLLRIKEYVFCNCNIDSVTFPSKLKELGRNCFDDSGLKDMNWDALPNIKLGEECFKSCLFETIHVPIFKAYPYPEELFSSCKQAKTIIFEKEMKEIPKFLARSCYSLEEIVFPEAVEVIGHQAFSFCYSLKKLSFPSTLKTIASDAFFSCSKLESLELNDGIQYIGVGAFEACERLKYVNFPSSLKEIKANAFSDAPLTKLDLSSCSNLVMESSDWSAVDPATFGVKVSPYTIIDDAFLLKYVDKVFD